MARVMRAAATAGVVAVLALLGITFPSAANAATASETTCAAVPGNDNCDGVWINETGTCWDSSYVVASFPYADGSWQFETDLRYSTVCETNFSVTTLTATAVVGYYEFSGKVRREAGPDGAYVMEHGGSYRAYPWSGGAAVISPMVYSPDNLAQACFSNDSNDQVKCTGEY